MGYFWTPSEEIINAVILVSIAFYIIVLQFFRIPNRKIVLHPNLVLAPADGKVVVIEKTTESEYFQDERIQLSIFMSPLNVHTTIVCLFRVLLKCLNITQASTEWLGTLKHPQKMSVLLWWLRWQVVWTFW